MKMNCTIPWFMGILRISMAKINYQLIILSMLFFSTQTVFAVDDAISVSGPSSISPTLTYQVTVNYEADADRQVSVYLFNTSNWTTHGSASTLVSAGSGSVTLDVTVANPPYGTTYQWTGKVETVTGDQLDQASAWCQVVFTPTSSDVTVSADFTSLTGEKVNRRAFGLNAFKAFNPEVTGNATYKANVAAMNPGHIRYHSWEMIAIGHPNSWLDANGDWVPAKIADAMEGAYPATTEILINIPWPPSIKGWLDSENKLKVENYTDFANWCADLVQIVNVDQGRNVVLWELTNERDEVYDNDNTELGKIFNISANACLAVDPSIKVGGPAYARPDHIYNVSAFMEETKDLLDFFSYHSYPYGQVPSNQAIFDRALTLGKITTDLKEEWANHSTREIEFHHNEYNMSWNPPQDQMDNEVMMVFDALVMIDLLNAGTDVGAAWNECDGWFGKMTGSYDREPSSWGFENFNNNLLDGDIYTSSTSDSEKIVQLAAKKGNTVQVVAINRSEATQNVKLDLSGLGTIDGASEVTITEAIQSGGLNTSTTTFTAVSTGTGYTSAPFAVTIFTIEISDGSAAQSPFGGTSWAIPGTIQAEDFDNGGEGTAYHDTGATNQGGQYRTDEGVDIQTCTEGGYNVGWTSNGEWLEYTVNVGSVGIYDIAIRVASPNSNGNVHIEFDGADKTGIISVPNSGGWQSWTTISVNDVTLSAGEQIMRVFLDNGQFNINEITINSSSSSPVGNGKVNFDYWNGIGGTAVSQIPTGTTPDGSQELTKIEAPTNWADNFGGRIAGYIIPSTSGDYTFYIAADDNTELWLSTDSEPANKQLIASHTGWTSSRQWTKYSSQTSAGISLTEGTYYYFEALYKEGGGGDNCAVGWTGPGISNITVVGSENISSLIGDNQPPSVSIISPTGGSEFGEGTSFDIETYVGDTDGTISKVEFFNGSTLLGEVTSAPFTYTLSNASPGSYSLTAKAIDNDNGTATSSPVNITVNPAPPIYYIYSETGDDFGDDGGSSGNYAMSPTILTTGAPEGSEYTQISPGTNYASYRFEYGSSGLDKSIWSNATLEVEVNTTADFDIYLEDATGATKRLALSSFITKSGSWESVQIPVSDFTGVDLSQISRIGFYRLWNADITLGFDNLRITGIGSGAANARKTAGNTSLASLEKEYEVMLYPNPIESGKVVNILGDFEKINSISVLDITGKVIQKVNDTTKKFISTNSMTSGVYFIRIESNGNFVSRKLIIK